MLVAGFSTRPSSPWRSFPSTFPLVFLPWIRDGRHCGWHGAPRFLSLARCRRVGLLSFSTFDSPLVGSVPSCCWCFTLRCFCAFLGLAVLADASTAFAIVSHPHHIQIFYFSVQSALYAASRGLFPNSLLPVPIPANLKFVATPVDRSLVMRALGGAITSPCSNDPESRRPHTYNLWIVPPLVVYLLDAIGLANTDNGTLWETAGLILCLYLACTVATLLQNKLHREFFC